MAKENKNTEIKFKVANTFADILNDKSANLYEIFLKPTNGNTIKRYLARGSVHVFEFRGGKKYTIQCYSKVGQPIFSWYSGIKFIALYQYDDKGLDMTSVKVQCDYRTYTAYTSREDAYNAAMHGLRLQKLKINKQISKLQDELYSV